MGENLFHPWCSDKQSRFAFLTGILQSHPTDSSVLCRALEGPSSTVFNTPHHDSDDETFISGLVTSFLQDPEDLLTSLIGQSKLENVRSNTAKEMLLSKLKSQDEFQLHQALSCLLSAICRVDPNSPVLPSLHCLCSFTMESYVSRIKQPLPQDISDQIIDLSKLPSHHIYVFESLLPCLLLPSGHHQSPFVLDILQLSDHSSRISLLCSLCRSENIWPSESYPVVRFLLCQSDDIAAVCPLIVHAFHRQVLLDSDLNKSVQFAGLLMFFLRNPSVKVIGDSWVLLNRIGQQNETFLRTSLCSLIGTLRFDGACSRSPVI